MVQSFSDIARKKQSVPPPAYEWQDLALRIIDELGIPRQKRNAVFRVCKLLPKRAVEKALNENIPSTIIKRGIRIRFDFICTLLYDQRLPLSLNIYGDSPIFDFGGRRD